MSTAPSAQVLFRYIPGVGKVATSVAGPTGITGPTGSVGAFGPLGNVLRVDAVNGDYTLANASPPRLFLRVIGIYASHGKYDVN